MTNSIFSFILRHKVVLGIFLLALFVRLVYLGISIEANGGGLLHAISGADDYYVVSQNLIEGHGLSRSDGLPYEPYSFRPPLYHFFIAGTYHLLGGWWGVILAQILIASFLPLLGMRLASYLVESRKLQMLVGVILAIEPSGIRYSTVFYSETLSILFFFAALWALFAYFKDKRLTLIVLSALFMGIATLTRPTTLYVPIIVVAVLLWESRTLISRRVWAAAGVYIAIFLLVLSPWVYRNYSIFGVAAVSPQTGVALYMTLLPTVLSIENGTTFQSEFSALEASGIKGPNNASITDGAPYVKEVVPLLLEHPNALALSILNSAWSFFVLDGMFDFLRHIEIRPGEMLGKPSTVALFNDPVGFASYFARNLQGPLAFILISRLLWIGITLALIYGIWRYLCLYGARPVVILVIALILYTAATAAITGYGLSARLRLPVNVFIVTMALYGVLHLVNKVRLRYGI